MLLYPERGLELTETRGAHRRGSAARSGRSAAIVGRAGRRHRATPRERIEGEVLAFLRALDDAGLLVVTCRSR